MSTFRTAALAGLLASVFAVQAGASNHPDGARAVTDKITGAALSGLTGFADDCGGISVSGTVTATGVTSDAGGADTFVVQLFDDGIQKGFAQFSVPVGSTQSFTFNFVFPGPVLTVAPGVGLYVAEVANGTAATFVDPFFPQSVSGCTIGQTTREVPTLSTWATVAMAGILLAVAGWFGFRRKQ